METYLNIGHDYISPFLFHHIKDGTKIYGTLTKPSGGLWLTRQEKEVTTGNAWVEYLSWHPATLVYGNYLEPCSNTLKCSLVSLKDTAKIYYLDTLEKFEFLLNNYSLNDFFSYEKLAKEYDGIFIDIHQLMYKVPQYKSYFARFDVNTLILFNVKAIDYYYPGKVTIEDLDENFEFNLYHISYNLEKEYIHLPLKEDETLILQIEKFFIAYLQKLGFKTLSTSNYAIYYKEFLNVIKTNFANQIENISLSENISQEKLILTLMDNALIKFK